MTKLLLPVAFFIAILFTGSCRNHHSGTSVSHDGHRTTVTINDETGHLKIVSDGEINFTDDDSAIAEITDGGFIRITRNGKKVEAENIGGTIVYKFNDGRETSELDSRERRFIAESVRTLINHGIGAERRMQRMYEKGGVAMVLDKTRELESDYVKRLYLEYLLSKNNLTRNELLITAQLISHSMGSDYDKAQLLDKFSSRFYPDAETMQAYLIAVKSIGSDYEKAGALNSVLSHQLPDQQYTYAINTVRVIGSNYEKSEVLKKVIEHRTLTPEQQVATIVSIGSIDSDYEKSNTVHALLDKNQISPENYPALLTVVASIQSDHDKSNTLKKLIEQPISSEDAWVSVLTTTAGISSEYEKANVLEEIGGKMPVSQLLRDAYIAAAKTIQSEYEFGRVMKAIR